MTDLLNTKEVAELLEISQGRVRQIAQRGYLKASHVGRDWVFRRNDVEIFRDSPKRRAGRPRNTRLLEKAMEEADMWRNRAISQNAVIEELIKHVPDKIQVIRRQGWYLGVLISED